MQNFFLQPITACQVKCDIFKVNSKKSPGDDDMGTNIIQLCPDVFSQNLSKIYNDSISKSYLVSIRYLKNYYVNNHYHS